MPKKEQKIKVSTPEALNFYRTLGTDCLYMQPVEKIEKLMDIVNEKKFNVSDTELTYRQINYLDANNTIKDERENANGWRKFSFKEVLFLKILSELKQFGLKDNILSKLSYVFLDKKFKLNSDIVMINILSGKYVTLTINNKLDIAFYDGMAYEIYKQDKEKIFIKININELFIEIFSSLKEKLKYKTFNDILAQNISDLNEQEKKILEIIRNKEYKSIEIRKSNGESFIIKAQVDKIIEEKDVLNMLKDKDFVDLNITKRDGTVVNINMKEAFKF